MVFYEPKTAILTENQNLESDIKRIDDLVVSKIELITTIQSLSWTLTPELNPGREKRAERQPSLWLSKKKKTL